MSKIWIDEEGDDWDRDCRLCSHCHERIGEYTAKKLDKCKVRNQGDFLIYKKQGKGNTCPDFRTDEWVF